ncbi:adenosine deaminase [Flavobacterium noncentrifugens]|uniref:adenosine deaminase n=1 Tax=Flavobacterium noncentrifugens TaxID=1128970 RepID=A0A1G8SGF1_9FLAO|nr:hypothetical protein [Flavobacterium noncentrifugens]GEP49822.1 adenosine deaminase [Flavobacterium noncentrifugens]SDJ28329.1 adenosine deaminase [Flavobacterium noncentrifugens]
MNNINAILDDIRPNRSALFSFFSMMPKGGDLHHHYSGSIYAETYIDYVFQKDFYINTNTYEIAKDIGKIPTPNLAEWKKISDLPNTDQIKLKLLRNWSVKDFVKGAHSSDEHFFSTFPSFGSPSKDNYVTGLKELKNRAINQKLNYIETIFISIDLKSIVVSNESDLDTSLLKAQKNKDETELDEILNKIFNNYERLLNDVAIAHNEIIQRHHTDSNIEDENFKIRYQNYTARFKQPTDVFIEMITCFQSCVLSDLIVGVNIVAAENGETAMRDYWLHMRFFKFLEQKYPTVNYAIHAGELVSGMVQPEYLGKHIRQSLILDNLKRIGHAVDIIYDNDFINTISKLKQKKIAIEINLTSNEFILGVADDMHPVEIYYRNGIPIVICTDDEGVLRTSITEQYVLLAHRYKLTYEQIKEVVKNSIVHSNIEDAALKDELLAILEKQFNDFEDEIQEFYSPIVFTDKNILKFQNVAFH